MIDSNRDCCLSLFLKIIIIFCDLTIFNHYIRIAIVFYSTTEQKRCCHNYYNRKQHNIEYHEYTS